MIVALVDNGSLEPAAHRNVRAVAAALAERTGAVVHAVSWKHSNRIRSLAFAGSASPGSVAEVPLQPDGRAWTLAPWVRAMIAAGEREFLFVPFFVSAQGAIGSALREDLENLQRKIGGFDFSFTGGIAGDETLVRVVASRIRDVIGARGLHAPPVIVVDHGGPSPASATLRSEIAAAVRRELGPEIGPLAAASLEGTEYAHNQPLLADQLGVRGFDRGEIVVAPLFLAPGRHAGPRGDLAQVARAAEDRLASPPLRCHFTELVGTHPFVVDTLATALRDARLNVSSRSDSTSSFTSETSLSSIPPGFSPGFQPSPFSA
ncbi:MAG: CbiX/SirB N-terminal domain-containing protein [Opitutaceae bacterium]|nr:CbiX/SirB N-terminal domain-containing protein [Opitutaceae bacterium]